MNIVERLRDNAERGVYRGTDYMEAADEIERLQGDLAAAQAREAKLREAVECLAKLADDDRLSFDYALAGEIFHEVAALDNDDTALRERLKAERERLLGSIEKVWYSQGMDIRGASLSEFIRALED